MNMNFLTVKALLDQHIICKILRAERAAFIITFLDRAYVSADGRARPENELVEILAELIAEVNDKTGADIKIDPRRQLSEWSSDRFRYLRRFTKAQSTEYFYDITQQARRAVDLVSTLTDRPYVGTEARLNIVMNLAKEVVLQGDASHAAEYLADLKKQRARLDARIAALESGQAALLTPEEIYDHFCQFQEQARTLLSDQREVEENFRNLYRDIRRQVESEDGPKAILLDKFFEKTDLISSSEQGRSAAAFNRLLLSADGRELLEEMVDELYDNPVVQSLPPEQQDQRLRELYPQLLENSTQINQVLAGLDKQLNNFIGSQLYLEARAVNRAGRQITAVAVQHPELMELKDPFFLSFELPQVQVCLPVDRPLYTKTEEMQFETTEVQEGDEQQVDTGSLLDQKYIDVNKLRDQLYIALSGRGGSISLRELTERFPLEFGAEELFAYLELAAEEFKVRINKTQSEQIGYSRELSPEEKTFSVLTMDRTEIGIKTEADPDSAELIAGPEEIIGIIEPRPRAGTAAEEAAAEGAGGESEAQAGGTAG